MAKPHFYRVYPYRVERGDVDDKPFVLPFPMEGLDDLEAAAKQLILNMFNAPRRAGRKPPHTADIVDEDGRVAFTVEVRSPNEAVVRMNG